MKKLYTFLAFLFMASLGNAAVITIAVNASAFSPNAVNAACGDTIIWHINQPGTHTTTSTNIPGCATPWNSPISIASPTFAITIPQCPGTYNYECTPHGFTGTITVAACTNGISNIDNSYLSVAYPNPFSNKITIELPAADMLSFYNMVGEKIKTVALQRGQTKTEINVDELNNGIYFYSLIKEGVVIETRKIVKN